MNRPVPANVRPDALSRLTTLDTLSLLCSKQRNRFLSLQRLAVAGVALATLALLPATVSAQRRPPAGPGVAHAPRVRDYHVRHLALVFNVNAADHSANATVTHFLTPLNGPLPTVKFDARANLRIEAVKIDGVEAKFEHTGDLLAITPANPLPQGKEAAVEIRYVMPNGARGGGANGAGGFTWIDPTPTDPERQVGFWTQGETTTNSSWVPCYDAPNDKCTSETHTTVPETWTVIGNGTELPSTFDPVAHTRTYHWVMKQPHSTYLLSLVGGLMDVQKDSWRGVPLYYAVPKGRGQYIPGTFGNTPDMLSLFSDTLGVKYPWPKYAQTLVYDFPGGMENVSATTLGPVNGMLRELRSSHFGSSSINSHELAHQWFGDMVTCNDWGDIWLNESFATFFEMYYMEHLDGEERYQSEVEGNTRQYLGSAQRFKRALSTPIYANPDAMFEQGHTYAKGGVILHMLRRELGDKTFFKGLGLYLKKYQYTPVETANLESTLSAYTKRDLKPWFDQWVFKPGHPVLDMTWTYDETRKEVVATVKQTQDTSDGTPVYTLPLTFGLIPPVPAPSDDPKAKATPNPLIRQKGTLTTATQEFRLPSPTRPAVVLLDPDHDLLREIKDKHLTAADWPLVLRYSPDSVERRSALSAIVNAGNLDATKAALFVDALKTETASGIAAVLIDQLGGLEDAKYRPLFEAQAQIKDPVRRVAALKALAKLPPTPEDVRIERTLAASDTEQYSVVTAALKALGKHKAVVANIEVFRHQLGKPTSYSTLASASIEALGEAKDDACVPLLLEIATNPKNNTYLRRQAVRAIDTTAPTNATIHQSLVKLLDDSDADVQVAVAETLAYRKDKEALPALKTLSTSAKAKSVQDAAAKAAANIEQK